MLEDSLYAANGNDRKEVRNLAFGSDLAASSHTNLNGGIACSDVRKRYSTAQQYQWVFMGKSFPAPSNNERCH